MPGPHDAWSRALSHADGAVNDAGSAGDWQPLGKLVERPRLQTAIAAIAARKGCEDRVAVGSVLVRDLLAPLTRLAVAAWSEDGVVLDVSVDNVLVDVSGDDPLLSVQQVGGEGGEGDDALDRLDAMLFEGTATAVIAGLRRAVTVGSRHLWGNVALAVVNTLASLSHRPGSTADTDRAALLARRPELASLVEITTAADGRGGTITYAIRRNCCLLAKLPPGTMCGTCSLRPRDDRVAACDAHYRAERSAFVRDAATGRRR